MTLGTGLGVEGAVKPTSLEVDTFEHLLHASRYTEIPSNMQMRADYSGQTDGKPEYLGFAPRSLASATTGWLLQKFTYDGSRQVTLRQIAYDSWDNRATASYA